MGADVPIGEVDMYNCESIMILADLKDWVKSGGFHPNIMHMSLCSSNPLEDDYVLLMLGSYSWTAQHRIWNDDIIHDIKSNMNITMKGDGTHH